MKLTSTLGAHPEAIQTEFKFNFPPSLLSPPEKRIEIKFSLWGEQILILEVQFVLADCFYRQVQ